MKSSQKNSVAHLETMRQRRMRRIKRQRAIEVGKPVDVSLKPMALNPAQKRVLSDLHVQPLVDQKHGIMTPKSVSVMAALGLHLIAALLATYYIVWPTRLDAEATIVEIVHSIPTRSVRQQFCNIGLIRPSRVVETPNPNPSGLGCPTAPNSSGNFVPTPGYEKIRRGAFSSLEVTRPPSFRIRVEPKYPSEAKRAGRVRLFWKLPLTWMEKPKTLRSRKILSDLDVLEQPWTLWRLPCLGLPNEVKRVSP